PQFWGADKLQVELDGHHRRAVRIPGGGGGADFRHAAHHRAVAEAPGVDVMLLDFEGGPHLLDTVRADAALVVDLADVIDEGARGFVVEIILGDGHCSPVDCWPAAFVAGACGMAPGAGPCGKKDPGKTRDRCRGLWG